MRVGRVAEMLQWYTCSYKLCVCDRDVCSKWYTLYFTVIYILFSDPNAAFLARITIPELNFTLTDQYREVDFSMQNNYTYSILYSKYFNSSLYTLKFGYCTLFSFLFIAINSIPSPLWFRMNKTQKWRLGKSIRQIYCIICTTPVCNRLASCLILKSGTAQYLTGK